MHRCRSSKINKGEHRTATHNNHAATHLGGVVLPLLSIESGGVGWLFGVTLLYITQHNTTYVIMCKPF